MVRELRARYQSGGIRTLEDLPLSERPRSLDEIKIVVAALERRPGRLA